MAKYNIVQKRKRAEKAVRKRAIHGDPVSRKLTNKPEALSVSGKRQRKLLKKWRREQKEALEKGLVTMQDIEMITAEDTSVEDTKKSASKFHMKKGLKLKQLKRRGKKGRTTSKPAIAAEQPSGEAMVE